MSFKVAWLITNKFLIFSLSQWWNEIINLFFCNPRFIIKQEHSGKKGEKWNRLRKYEWKYGNLKTWTQKMEGLVDNWRDSPTQVANTSSRGWWCALDPTSSIEVYHRLSSESLKLKESLILIVPYLSISDEWENFFLNNYIIFIIRSWA